MDLAQYRAPVDYDAQQSALEDFLAQFKTTATDSITDALGDININGDDLSDDDDLMGDDDVTHAPRRDKAAPRYKYKNMMQKLANRQLTEVLIDLDDLEAFEHDNDAGQKLVESTEQNTKHYVELISRAIDKLMPEPESDVNFKDDVLDVVMSRRTAQNQELQIEAERAGNPMLLGDQFPAELTRRYHLIFKPRSSVDGEPQKSLAVRGVRGDHLGHLITVRAIATRVSDVKPMVQVNAYSCERCGCEIFQPVSEKQYSPLTMCPSDDCKQNQTKGRLQPSTRASKFLPFQEVKVQELAEQVPIGQIPRTLSAHCYGSQVRRISPGDVVDIAGVFLPTPYTGFKAMKAGLLTDTYLEAHHIRQHKKAYENMTIDRALSRRIEEYHQSGQVYELLAKSIAPEIFGHVDVKKALLLLLVGGVTKQMGDGMKIRGDINMCLMGDPGVAKSQLLKYISKVAPRGVYTSGRGSSGVGLTAAVMRDPVTDEMVLEGGALVLADNGICCIDEFDKMDDNDRTAIHEVMEQQTISISKAGISTTLNARTSILAAANPVYGRYNPRISPVENINLPAALLSRFDILFLILDTPNRELDEQLAKHVTYVHTHCRHPDLDVGGIDADSPPVVFTPHEVRSYVAKAREFRPVVPADVSEYLVKMYVRLREGQRRAEKKGQLFTHTTPRTLLGVTRLAQALARLRFDNRVIRGDVDEALRLIEASKESLATDGGAGNRRGMNATARIYNLVKGILDSGACRPDDEDDEDDEDSIELSMRKVKERAIGKGFTEDQWLNALEEYTDLDVWQTAGNGTRLVFVTGGNGGAHSDDDM